MRKILFKAKKNETEWAFGNYMEKKNPQIKEDTFWACFIQDQALSMYKVNRETVCQFTGVLDINDHKVFYHDRVVHEIYGEGTIEWNEDRAMFYVDFDDYEHEHDMMIVPACALKGNIHDHPGLEKTDVTC
jgi:hypothetical protein